MILTPTKLDLPILRAPHWPAYDRAIWEAEITNVGWFDDGGRLARYPQRRIRIFESAYGRWLGFLRVYFPDLALVSGLDHFGRDQVVAYYECHHAVLAPCTVRAYITDLLTVVRAMAPVQSFEALHNAARHIWRTAEPVTDKNASLVPARDLFTLGFDLMRDAPELSTELKRASQYLDGLMIAMLIAVPVRLGNFVAIEIDRHLLKKNDDYWLVFPGSEVKNGRPLEYRLPASLCQPIETYLEQHRPHLLARRGRFYDGDPGNALWISEHGTALKRFPIRERIKRRTRERFGFPVIPHRFRDCAATSIAIEDPEHVGIIMTALGHAYAKTGEQIYNQARSLEAARRYQAVIDGFRDTPGDRP